MKSIESDTVTKVGSTEWIIATFSSPHSYILKLLRSVQKRFVSSLDNKHNGCIRMSSIWTNFRLSTYYQTPKDE